MRCELEDLIVRLKLEDREAFTALFYLYADKLHRFAKSYLYDSEEAEEIVQEVFLKIWLKRNAITDASTFDAYLFTIAKNLIFNVLKKKVHSNKYKESLKNKPKFENSTDNQVIFNETEKMIKQAVEQLPKKRKLVFILSRKVGLKNHEIAEKLNLSIKTVETHMSLSLKHLKNALTLNSNRIN